MLLKDSICWITGASRGIGRATAFAFARQGARLILSSRSEEELQKVANEVEAIGAEAKVIPVDVENDDSRKAAFRAIQQYAQRMDVLVNNAGVMSTGLIGMIKDAEIDRIMHTNVNSVISLMQMASRFMARQKSGAIINVASILGKTGGEGQIVYSASKAAVIAASISAAKELGPQGIRVNAVAPGLIQTNMTSGLGEARIQAVVQNIKLGRIGVPEEVADVILFLASPLSRYVTGQVVGVDGGMWS